MGVVISINILKSWRACFRQSCCYFTNIDGPRHTRNLVMLEKFSFKKYLIKNWCSQKCYWYFKSILQHISKLTRTYYPLKKPPDFDSKEFENFLSWKKCIFNKFTKIVEFHFQLNRLVLTRCWLKYRGSIQNLL